jgi:hypothetical protein
MITLKHLKWRSSLRIVALCFGILSLRASLGAVDFKSSADLQLGADYSDLQGVTGSVDLSGQLLFLPLWKLGSSDYVVPAIYYTEGGRSVALNEGNSLNAYFVKSLVLTGEPVWKHDFGQSGWESGVYGMAIHGYLGDTQDEPWGEGFYDYEQYGAGLQLSKKDLLSWLGLLAADLSYAHMGFPNYHGAKVPGEDKNYYINDMNITKLDLNASLPDSVSLFYSISLRNYTDDYQYLSNGDVNPDGVGPGPSSDLRVDTYEILRLSWSHPLNEHWAATISLEGDYWASNYNAYVVGVPQPYLYDVDSNEDIALAPSLSWMPEGDPKGDILSLSWRGQYLNYLHRDALDLDGFPDGGTENDFDNTFTLFGRKMLWGPLSVYGKFVTDSNRSNQDFQTGGNNTYTIYDLQLGLEYQY